MFVIEEELILYCTYLTKLLIYN